MAKEINLTEKQYDFINLEMEMAYTQIDKQRETAITYLKIYFSILLGLFAYISFVENKLIFNNQKIALPSNDFIVFGGFGLIICLITFLIGWALLDNVTKTVSKSVKYYKHISYLRALVSQTFSNDSFRMFSVLPLEQETVPMRISKHVPIIGGIVNFALLILCCYFFHLFVDWETGFLLTSVIMTTLSIFYANLIEKHFEEVLIAQLIIPLKDENVLKSYIRRLVLKYKSKRNYKTTRKIYKVTLWLFLLSILILSYNKYLNHFFDERVFFYLIPTILFCISIVPRTFMGIHRIQQIVCFE